MNFICWRAIRAYAGAVRCRSLEIAEERILFLRPARDTVSRPESVQSVLLTRPTWLRMLMSTREFVTINRTARKAYCSDQPIKNRGIHNIIEPLLPRIELLRNVQDGGEFFDQEIL